MVCQANIIDNIAPCFAFDDPVYPRDGLKEIVIFYLLVDVHDLLYGGIKAGEQHVAHDQKGDTGVHHVGIIIEEGQLEIIDCVDVSGMPAGPGDDCAFVGAFR